MGANRQQQERDRTVAASVLESMETQLIALYGEKEMLENSIGVSDAASVVELVKELEERVRRHEPDFSRQAKADDADTADESAGGDGLKDFAQRIRVLTGTVTSMEAQLIDVYADRELLYREAGIKQTQDVLVRMRENENMREQIRLMEKQLAALFAQKHTLQEGLGVSDAREVVALVQGVAGTLEAAHRSMQKLMPPQNTPRRNTGGKRIKVRTVATLMNGAEPAARQTPTPSLESEINA